MQEKEKELRRIYRFMYKTGPGSSETPIEYSERLEACISEESAGRVYKPRKASIMPNFRHFSMEQRKYVLHHLHDFLYHFGYATSSGEPVLLPKRIACKNKGVVSSMLVNSGKCARPLTKEDPMGRGFPWKWEMRKIVKLRAKDGRIVIGAGEHQRELSEETRSSNSVTGNDEVDGGAPSEPTEVERGDE